MLKFLLTILVLWILWTTIVVRNPFERVYAFFRDSSTKYVSENDLEYLSKVQSVSDYVDLVETEQNNPLNLTLLVGQLLKEIWRDRDIKLLKEYLNYLEISSINRTKWIESVKSHSVLFKGDFGEWEEAENIFRSYNLFLKSG
jgi:hypothetical protein